MTRAIMAHNQASVVLSLSIITASPTGPQVVTLPLANLTPFLVALWQCWQWLDRLTTEAAHLAARLVFSLDRLTVWLTLALILALAIGWAIKKGLAKNYAKNYVGNYAKNSKGLFSGFWGGLGNER